jgi:putative FmdB family regulatory protein
MPIYDFKCPDCGLHDSVVGGLDDCTAVCPGCGGTMLRQDEDIFAPYFEMPKKGKEEG